MNYTIAQLYKVIKAHKHEIFIGHKLQANNSRGYSQISYFKVSKKDLLEQLNWLASDHGNVNLEWNMRYSGDHLYFDV